MSAEKRNHHAMLPGTHEWPRTPECRCGAAWDQWNDKCAKKPAGEVNANDPVAVYEYQMMNPPVETQRGGRVSARYAAAIHETRCRECRVTWKSWAQRLFTIPAGMSPNPKKVLR